MNQTILTMASAINDNTKSHIMIHTKVSALLFIFILKNLKYLYNIFIIFNNLIVQLKFNKFWFTFVELVVAMFISSLVLASVFYFLASNVDEITSSNNKTKFFNSLYDFREKMSSFSNIYSSWTIIIDNESWTWSDTIMLTSYDSSEWVLIWVVPEELLKIETSKSNYELYYKKVLWFRKLSSLEISSINSWWTLIKDLRFFKENLFDYLVVKDFQADYYNSWSILNLEIVLIDDYDQRLDWDSFSGIKWQSYYNVNLNF